MVLAAHRSGRRLAAILAVALVASFLVVVQATPALASHFRYRDLTWTLANDSASAPQIAFKARIADRRSFYGSLQVGDPFSEHVQYGDGSSGSMAGRVVSVNVIDDWFIAELTSTHAYPGPGPWEVTWQSCCTLSSLNNSPDSSLKSRGVVHVGADGNLNRGGPASSLSPIVNIPAGGGTQTYRIPGRDPDGNQLSFRLASYSESLVSQPPGLSVDSRTGVATWNTSGLRNGLWIATVVLDDGRGAQTQVTHLLNLGGSSSGQPLWERPTPDDGEKLTARVGRSVSFELRASDPAGDAVVINDLGRPAGLTCTDAQAGLEAVRSCTWTPTTSGFHLVTFDAQDPQGNSAGTRTYRIGSGTYVGLGDSYSSGESVAPYDAGTDDDDNGCHRSQGAYGHLVDDDPAAPSNVNLVACSGAITVDLTTGPNHKWSGEPNAQISSLSEDVELVTLTIGGNDAKFSQILIECIIGFELLPLNNCSGDDEKADNIVNEAFDALKGLPSDRDDIVPYDKLFRSIRQEAPNARVAVLGYPQFFKTSGTAFFPCSGVSKTDQKWVNSKVVELNSIIRDKAQSHGFIYVDYLDNATSADRFETHRLCEIGGGEDREWFTDIQVGGSRTRQQSYHPDVDGHKAMAESVLEELRATRGEVITLKPQETAKRNVLVEAGKKLLDFITHWPGSDFVLTATSPTGQVITRGGIPAGVVHDLGPTFERLSIPDPAPGEWTVEIYAADVKANGEEVLLTTHVQDPPNARPVAALTHVLDGATLAVDATGSTDPDGTIVDYLIDWGDGTETAASTGSHTYTKAGRYDVSVQVTDDRGGVDFVSVGGFDVSTYEFGGFAPPLRPQPDVNDAQAGRTIPVKWQLSTSDGQPVTDPSSFVGVQTQQVGCADGEALGDVVAGASQSGLQRLEDGHWQFNLQTARGWSGQCRTLMLLLDDGATAGRSVLVHFR